MTSSTEYLSPDRRPVTLDVNFDGIPDYLKSRHQWILWCWEWGAQTGKWVKVPKQTNGRNAKSNDKRTFCSFEEVSAAYATGKFSGFGFCFWEGDGLVGIDFDHCIDSNGVLKSWAREMLERFEGTYIEKSPSGDGLHIWCLSSSLDRRTYSGSIKWENPGHPKQQGVELFDCGSPRYFTVTGVSYV